MRFTQKYELLDPVPGEGGKSFQARQLNTGRDVAVHLLTGGDTPENQALLARLRKLPLDALAKVIEVGDHDGAKFVVTIAPPYLHLDEWLIQHERAAQSAHDQEFKRAGAWKVPSGLTATIPAAPSAPPPAEAGEFTKMFQAPPPSTQEIPTAPSAPPAAEPGEFTRMFQAPAASTREMPAAPSAPEPAAPPPSGPGEFTRMFQAPTPAGATTSNFVRVFDKPPATPPPGDEPGQFTRMFQAPPSAPAEPPASPAPSSGAPSEFTKMFSSPLPQAPAQGDWPPAPPKPAEAGEFTRMFQVPSAGKAVPNSPPPQAGEFTRMFQAPLPGTPRGPELPQGSGFPAPPPAASPAPGPPSSDPGSFTRMFGSPVAGPETPIPPPAQPFGGGSATQVFSRPPGGAPPPPAAQGPSEYTRMMSAQPGPASAPSAPPAPRQGAGQAPDLFQPGMPQMPQVSYQPPQAPQVSYQPPQMPVFTPPVVPQPVVPQPAATVKAPSTNLVLIAIGILLAFLAGGLIVYLLVRPKG